jgi:hypothetical protein
MLLNTQFDMLFDMLFRTPMERREEALPCLPLIHIAIVILIRIMLSFPFQSCTLDWTRAICSVVVVVPCTHHSFSLPFLSVSVSVSVSFLFFFSCVCVFLERGLHFPFPLSLVLLPCFCPLWVGCDGCVRMLNATSLLDPTALLCPVLRLVVGFSLSVCVCCSMYMVLYVYVLYCIFTLRTCTLCMCPVAHVPTLLPYYLITLLPVYLLSLCVCVCLWYFGFCLLPLITAMLCYAVLLDILWPRLRLCDRCLGICFFCYGCDSSSSVLHFALMTSMGAQVGSRVSAVRWYTMGFTR